jgi:type IV pilus assembly protein PilA
VVVLSDLNNVVKLVLNLNFLKEIKMMKQMQKGFTLIELMIVVAIIGILAAVAIPAYQDYIVKAKLSKVITAVDPLKLAIAQYVQEQGSYVTVAGVANSNGAGWTSLGLSSFATPITEAPKIAFNTAGTGGANQITVELGGIRSTTTNGKTIDGLTITMEPTLGTSVMTWKNTCPATLDPVAVKFFGC